MKQVFIEMKEVQLLFDAGKLKQPIITMAALQRGYNVSFTSARVLYCLRGQRDPMDTMRVFLSIDAAMNAIYKIGFCEAKISFPTPKKKDIFS